MSSQDKKVNNDKLRIDKWLWFVRLYKTRSLATAACEAGKVKIDGQNCKPSREIRIGDRLQVRIENLLKEVGVLGFPQSRISAQLVANFYTDFTPPEEYERVRMLRYQFERRESGIGRPSKRDRRQLDYLKDLVANDEEWKEN